MYDTLDRSHITYIIHCICNYLYIYIYVYISRLLKKAQTPTETEVLSKDAFAESLGLADVPELGADWEAVWGYHKGASTKQVQVQGFHTLPLIL